MSRELLCAWLNLPESPWPPDHYALLGLEAGQGSTDEIEQLVLERMEKLRHRQLTHPEQVTEGMNLLAQAMICLTDPEARQEYDRSRGVKSRKSAAPERKESRKSTAEPPVADEPTRPGKPPKTRVYKGEPPPEVDEPLVLPLVEDLPGPIIEELPQPKAPREIVYGEELPDDIIVPELDEGIPFADEDEAESEDEDYRDRDRDEDDRGRDRGRRRKSLADEEEAEDEYDNRDRDPDWDREPPPPPPGTEILDPRQERRKIYAEIARVRRILRVWDRLRIFLENPNETFSRRTDTVQFMAALSDLRPLLSDVENMLGGQDQPGNLVATLAKQQLVVEMFRSLLPSQRGALAQDCRVAHDELLGRYHRLRDEVRHLTAKSFGRRVWRPLCRHMAAKPEWFFLLIAIASLAIALVRSMPKH